MPATIFVRSPIVSARPPVLLIHGAANSSSAWKFWQKALARRGWSSYAIDLRGHGKSGGSVDGALMSDYVDDVTEVANELSVKPVVMGWSMGGLVALMAAAAGRGEGVRGSISDPTGCRAGHAVSRFAEVCTAQRSMESEATTQPNSLSCAISTKRNARLLSGPYPRNPDQRGMSARRES